MYPSEETPTFDPHQSNLLQVCSQLNRAAQRVDPRHPVAEQLLATVSVDDPHASWLQLAIDAFYSLPMDEQRRLLGGWRPHRERPDRRHVEGEATDGDLVRVIQIDAHADGRVSAEPSYAIDGGAAPVVVRIAEGTSKFDAIQAMMNAVMMLMREFETLVAQEPPAHFFKRE